jgi:hypothetical protein
MIDNNIHKAIKVIKEANVSDRFIDMDMRLKDVVKKSEEDDVLYKYNENTFICAYKTIHEKMQVVSILFVIYIGKGTPSTTAMTEQVMGIINMLEKNLVRVYSKYEVTTDKKGKNIALLQYVCKV